jgi:hypothetical protein
MLLDEALLSPVPVLIDIPIDYSHNCNLFITVHETIGN